MENELINIAEAAKMLGVKPVTLRKWDREGKLKALRIGSRNDRRYRKSDILQIIGQSIPVKYDVQEVDGSLLPFFDYIEEFINGVKRIYGQSITKHITISKNGHVKVAYPYQELLDTGKLIVEKLKNNLDFADKIIGEFNDCHQKTDKLVINFRSRISEEELGNLLQEITSIYRRQFAWTMAIEPLDAYLLQRIKEKIKVEPKQFTEIFGILTSPLSESFLLKEKKEILSIAKDFKKDNLFLKFLSQKQSNEKQKNYLKKNNPEIFKKIDEHTEKYIWFKSDYVKNIPLKFEDVLGLINEQLSEGVDIERELNKLKNYLPNLKKKKAEIIKQINPDEELRHLIWIIDKIGPLHDWRKEWFLKIMFLFEKILEAISKKHHLPIDALRPCSPEELFEVIKNGKLDIQLINERKKYCVIVSDKTGHKIYYGEKASQIEEQELDSGKNEKINIIKGTAVSAGKAVGIAKVAYSTEEAKAKIQKGDILVTSMTRPDFVPVMKLTSGIVTNEGGLTCHAAIVSREIGLPCVTGTRNATEIIQDGDVIEVNGNHGIIYIIKRKSGEISSLTQKKGGRNNWLLIQERGDNMPLLPVILPLFESYSLFPQKIFNLPNAHILLVFQRGGIKIYDEENEWGNYEKKTLGKIKDDPSFIDDIFKKFKNKLANLEKMNLKISQANLRIISSKRLWGLIDQYRKIYMEVYPWGEPFAFWLSRPLADYLEKYLHKILQANYQDKLFGEYFEILITPPQIPFTTKEEKSLLEISRRILKNKKLKSIFKKGITLNISKKLKNFPVIDKLINRHREKYKWLPFDYGNLIWDKNYFIKILADHIGTKFDINQRIKAIDNFYADITKKQNIVFKKLDIDKKHKKLFRALQMASYIIDYKKEKLTRSHFVAENMMKEIGVRFNLRKNQVRCLDFNDLKKILFENMKPNIEKLDERHIQMVVHIKDGKSKIMEGKPAQKFLTSQGLTSNKLSKITEVKGICASGGSAKGEAKIITNPKEFAKMENGNILITYMTTPDYITVMRKAAAIVTNEGGVTCHAAIVSREMNIPCIVGTKTATKIFKDGDGIEVRANHGVVKKISM